ncbi:MAG: LysR family transcriptional regulator [Pikeienuella sp.]
MDTVEGMRAFAAVAAHGSFTQGAQQLGISPKLISKYVQQLEARLSAQLFNRTTRSVSLTETGHAYLSRCLPLLDQFDELEGLVQARQTELAGPIRITAPTGFGGNQLVRALRPFQIAHPKVTLDLHLSDHHVPVIDQGLDLAIRFGEMKDSTLVAKKLMDMRFVCCAAPCYTQAHGMPRHPTDLAQHACLLQSTSGAVDKWAFVVAGKRISVPVSGTFRANSPLAVAQMAVGGAGICMIPHYTAEPFVETGRLQMLFEENEARVIGLYAVYPPNRHLTARIRALIDHLAEVFSQNQFGKSGTVGVKGGT